MFRIHRARFGPWHFANLGAGRFDLRRPDRGTCYFAEEPAGCFLEVFRSFTAAIPEEEIAARRLSQLAAFRDLMLADCTDPHARSWGITGEIHSTPAYETTQKWADALLTAGFDGIRYLLRHDPSQHLAGIALFGPERPIADYPEGETFPIRRELIQEMESRFGLRVLPPFT